MQIQQGQSAAEIHLPQTVYHWAAVYPWSISFLIHQAAFKAGIHYSTAKTILFFHKKNYKNYSSYFVQDPQALPDKTEGRQATWKNIAIDLEGVSTERQPI